MLYFAYGSNLNSKQMKRRCKESKYIGCYTLKNYKLTFRKKYYGGGVADIEKKKNSTVLGAIYNISKSDEKILDVYEDFPSMYTKKYFKIFEKKVMFYYMPKKTKGAFKSNKKSKNISFDVVNYGISFTRKYKKSWSNWRDS